jgi:hypothetical protein
LYVIYEWLIKLMANCDNETIVCFATLILSLFKINTS